MVNAQHEDSVGSAGDDADVFGTDDGTRVKICGITNAADARSCVAAGADMLGFNFYRKSPRYIDPERAREIISSLPETVLSVGVFVNEPSPAAVAAIADQASLGALQLHGEESPEFCDALLRWPVIKAFRVGPGFDPSVITPYHTPAILLDGFAIQTHGGTGRAFDWRVAEGLTDRVERVFLAGGLGVNNVAEAIRQVRPFAVDACSRLELRPGIKDPTLVASFVEAVRSVKVNA